MNTGWRARRVRHARNVQFDSGLPRDPSHKSKIILHVTSSGSNLSIDIEKQALDFDSKPL